MKMLNMLVLSKKYLSITLEMTKANNKEPLIKRFPRYYEISINFILLWWSVWLRYPGNKTYVELITTTLGVCAEWFKERNFEHIPQISLIFLLLTFGKYLRTGVENLINLEITLSFFSLLPAWRSNCQIHNIPNDLQIISSEKHCLKEFLTKRIALVIFHLSFRDWHKC